MNRIRNSSTIGESVKRRYINKEGACANPSLFMLFIGLIDRVVLDLFRIR